MLSLTGLDGPATLPGLLDQSSATTPWSSPLNRFNAAEFVQM
jgi:hypothetical protein